MNPNERRIYGWDYPPGAELDPRAPYNQVGDKNHCARCEEELTEDNDETMCKFCQLIVGKLEMEEVTSWEERDVREQN